MTEFLDEYVIPVPVLDRIPILLIEEGKETYCHGLVFPPVGMTLTAARTRITELFVEVRRENEEEWSYDDLGDKLVADGWLYHPVGMWHESDDGYPGD